MGVPSDKLTTQMGSRAHLTVDKGGMGTQMAETRFPAITILDAIWINANMKPSGPVTTYAQATRINTIAASTSIRLHLITGQHKIYSCPLHNLKAIPIYLRWILTIIPRVNLETGFVSL